MSARPGQVWMVNDSRRCFVIASTDARFAHVVRLDGSKGRIALNRLRESKAKTGYTLIEDVAPEAGPQ